MIKIAKKEKAQYLVSLKREQELAEKGWKVSRTKSYLEQPKKAIGKKGYPYAVLNKEQSYETFYTWKEKPPEKAKKKVKATKGHKWETSKGIYKGHTETWDVLKPKKQKVVLPKHVQQSPKKSQKRYIKYTTGSSKTQARMLAKARKKSSKRRK